MYGAGVRLLEPAERFDRMTATVDVPVQKRELSSQQRSWLESAWKEIDSVRLAQLDLELTSIPSPTGDEAQIARYLVDHLTTAGIDAEYQTIDSRQANALGRIRGSGEGPELLLFAPTDTMFAGTEEEDVPWL